MYFENQPTSPSPPPGDAGSKTLHQLARDGDTETIKLWFAESRNENPIKFINKLDEKKLSPLHYAARHSNIEVMKLLVENGADINKLGDDNMTPLQKTWSLIGKSQHPKINTLTQGKSLWLCG